MDATVKQVFEATLLDNGIKYMENTTTGEFFYKSAEGKAKADRLLAGIEYSMKDYKDLTISLREYSEHPLVEGAALKIVSLSQALETASASIAAKVIELATADATIATQAAHVTALEARIAALEAQVVSLGGTP